MRKGLLLTVPILFLTLVAIFLVAENGSILPEIQSSAVQKEVLSAQTSEPSVEVRTPPENYAIDSKGFVAQTFNNCGPATLSMVMSYFGKNVSQEELGVAMRPWQNPTGDNDDKSVSVEEFVTHAEKNGLSSLARPNGSLSVLKTLVANNIPVVVRTWLHPGEDIGHFRIVRGYDDARQVLIQDDSYEGPNLEFDYNTFLSMWQPFNYGYILVYSPDKEALVEEILGEDIDEKSAYARSIQRAEEELKQNAASIYSQFNLSSANYYLGNYEKAVEEYEKVAYLLPWRMLWYQIEPIRAYQKVGNAERVFALTDSILVNNNRAFSELYQMRGELYLEQGKKDLARIEFENAVYYNQNFDPAKKALENNF